MRAPVCPYMRRRLGLALPQANRRMEEDRVPVVRTDFKSAEICQAGLVGSTPTLFRHLERRRPTRRHLRHPQTALRAPGRSPQALPRRLPVRD